MSSGSRAATVVGSGYQEEKVGTGGSTMESVPRLAMGALLELKLVVPWQLPAVPASARACDGRGPLAPSMWVCLSFFSLSDLASAIRAASPDLKHVRSLLLAGP